MESREEFLYLHRHRIRVYSSDFVDWALGFGVGIVRPLNCTGILTGGGDYPSLNTIIRGMARPAESHFGAKALELASQEKSAHKVRLRGMEATAVPVKEATLKIRTVPLDSQLFSAARAVGTSLENSPARH